MRNAPSGKIVGRNNAHSRRIVRGGGRPSAHGRAAAPYQVGMQSCGASPYGTYGSAAQERLVTVPFVHCPVTASRSSRGNGPLPAASGRCASLKKGAPGLCFSSVVRRQL